MRAALRLEGLPRAETTKEHIAQEYLGEDGEEEVHCITIVEHDIEEVENAEDEKRKSKEESDDAPPAAVGRAFDEGDSDRENEEEEERGKDAKEDEAGGLVPEVVEDSVVIISGKGGRVVVG